MCALCQRASRKVYALREASAAMKARGSGTSGKKRRTQPKVRAGLAFLGCDGDDDVCGVCACVCLCVYVWLCGCACPALQQLELPPWAATYAYPANVTVDIMRSEARMSGVVTLPDDTVGSKVRGDIAPTPPLRPLVPD